MSRRENWRAALLAAAWMIGCTSPPASDGPLQVAPDPEVRPGCRTETTPAERRRLRPFTVPPRMLHPDRVLLALLPQPGWEPVAGPARDTLDLDVHIDARGRVTIAELTRSSGDPAADAAVQQAVCAAAYEPAGQYRTTRFDSMVPVGARVQVRVTWTESGAAELSQAP